MRVRVEITRRPEISDPQGSTTLRALSDLGHEGIDSVRVDRVIHLEIEGEDRREVLSRVQQMCVDLLANPVLEDFNVEIVE